MGYLDFDVKQAYRMFQGLCKLKDQTAQKLLYCYFCRGLLQLQRKCHTLSFKLESCMKV